MVPVLDGCRKSSWPPSQVQESATCDISLPHRGLHSSAELGLQLHVHTGHVFLFIPRILYLYLDVRKMKRLGGGDGWAGYLRHEIEMEEVQRQGNGPVLILHHTHARTCTHTHSLGHAAQRVYSGLYGREGACAEMWRRGARPVCPPHTNANGSAQSATFHIQTKGTIP